MSQDQDKQTRIEQAAQRALEEAAIRKKLAEEKQMAKEYNGPKGKEPTRYDDWERKGITYDF